jgi:glycosyltransferase involved in cell wall biosynthesis
MDQIRRILVISLGPVGTKMAAPGIRASNIARVLGKQLIDAEVTLVAPAGPPTDMDTTNEPFRLSQATGRDLMALAGRHQVIVTGQLPTTIFPAALRHRLVLDLYTPLVTEWSPMARWLGERHRRAVLESKRKHLLMELTLADLVLCANERQRDFVAGIMCTAGMITPEQLEEDPTLRNRIAIAPLGIRQHEPAQRANVLRGVWPGINPDDVLLIWNGTIIEWYDVETLLRAMANVVQSHPNVKLLFLGTQYPQAKSDAELQTIGTGAVKASMELAAELGLLDRNVFFKPGWADDATTEQCLLEADAGVSTYFDNAETHFSFRVRYLDLFWASLPIICTKGDVVSEMVEKRSLGIAVTARDVDGVSDAIIAITDPAQRERYRSNVTAMRHEFHWETTLAPLVEFCRSGSPHGPTTVQKTLPLAYRGLDWIASEAHEKLRFAYRHKLTSAMHGFSGGRHQA